MYIRSTIAPLPPIPSPASGFYGTPTIALSAMPGAFDSTTQLTAQSDPDLNLKPNNLNEAVDPNDATAQENVVLDDQVKLRMLGYKPVLGRPFGFWSSAGMNICYLSWIYESIICSIVFGYPAPLVFVSRYGRKLHVCKLITSLSATPFYVACT
jgi:hypothetical protein